MACITVTVTPLRDDSALTVLRASNGTILRDTDGVILGTGSMGCGIDVTITQVCSVS